MSEADIHGGISRRTLVKSTAIGSLALAAGGLFITFRFKKRSRRGERCRVACRR